MKPLPSDTVAIHRLHIRRGGGLDNGRMQQEAARLRQDIEWADWPDAPGESWVFIRQLQARAPRGQMVQRLMQAVREQVYSRGDDNVVRFANLTDLLAALLTDLVQGAMPRRWYWQRWAHLFALPLPQAVADLLTEHIAHLAAVCARLSRHRTLEQVWLALDEAGACRLRQALAWRSGFALPEWRAVQREQTRTPRARTPETRLFISHTVRKRWEPLLQRLPGQDGRYQLGLLLIGQEVAPLMLQQAPAALLARLSRVFVSLDPVPAATSGCQPPQPAARSGEAGIGDASIPPMASAASETRIHHQPWPAAEAAPPPARTQSCPPAPGETSLFSGQAETNPAVRLDAGAVSANPFSPGQNTPHADSHAQPALRAGQMLLPPPQARDLAFDRFLTGQGGLLYLLNVLNRSEAQAIMENFWKELPSGWGWLYRLGQELRLDETDPLVAFLAAQLGFDHPADLELLPPLPARAELLALTRRWYGRAGLWQPPLLRLTASIHATPSHVDLFAPLSAVQLPVRLAGLDINPGWLPWLGRIVSFHYD